MLTILPQNVVLEQDEYYIKQLATGLDELIFDISIHDANYPGLTEETPIRDRDQQTYLVKSIDAGRTAAKVKCQIDIDDWKSSMYLNYTNGSATIAATVNAIKPAGWTVVDQSGATYRRTVTLEAATALEILDAARDVYKVTYRFDNSAKQITIIKPTTYTSLGAYLTRDLNLTEVNYKGKSTGFATRLYAYGKDGLSFADINGGLPYVQNTTYSTKIISAYWRDERYTVKANLLADAQSKLDAMAVPQSSYTCSVYDLAQAIPEMYGFLDFSLFQIVTLIDDIRNTRVNHQIVEHWIYPHYPEKNTVVLSTETPRIQSQVKAVQFELDNVTSVYNQNQIIKTDEAVKSATDWITAGTSGGYVMLHRNANGQPDELIITDNPDLTDPNAKVWRWNSGGLGYSSTGYNGTYGTAITAGGQIVGDYISTGVIADKNGNVAIDLTNGTLTLVGAKGAMSFDGSNLEISGRVTADSGEIGGFSIDSKGNLAGATELKVGNMTLSGSTISGASSFPGLKLGASQLDYSNFENTGTIYLLGINGAGQLRLFDIYLKVQNAGATETTGAQSAIYSIVPTSPGGTPPSPVSPNYASVVQITSDGEGANLRTGPDTSYPSGGQVATGSIWGGPNNSTATTTGGGYTWAIVDRHYAYNAATGKYTATQIGTTYYIAQTNSSGSRYYWNSTQVQV